MKKTFLYIAIFFLFSLVLFSQEENEQENSEIPEQQEEQIEEEKIDEEQTEEETVFRDPIFGIDYTNADLGAMTDFDIIDNKDTLRYTRYLGKWWYGAYWNPTFSGFLGNYNFNKISYLPTSTQNPKVEYNTNPTSTLVSLGAIIEWNPVRQVWGLGARLHYERLYVNSDHDPEGSQFINRTFNTNVLFNYFGISPYFKYKTPLSGLNLMVGLDFMYPGTYEASFFDRQSTTSQIIDEKVIQYEDEIGLRFGMHGGVEFEFMAMDIQKAKLKFLNNTRMKIAPFAMAGITTSPILKSGGSNPWSVRVGLAIKLGPDEIKSDTIKYDPSPRLDYLAKFEKKIQVKFDGFLVRDRIESTDLALVDVEQISNQVSEEPKLDPSALRNRDESQVATSLVEDEKPKIEFKKGFNKTFTYQSSTGTRPDRKLRDFLDELAEWMKNNTNAEIRVVGHSDQVGTPKEIQERSEARAKEVQRYIVGKTGIPSRRILTTGEGARRPVADIYSEAGKAKNRRVEIIVVGG